MKIRTLERSRYDAFQMIVSLIELEGKRENSEQIQKKKKNNSINLIIPN